MRPAIFLVIVLLALALISGCSKTPDQQQWQLNEYSQNETAQAINGVDNSFINDSDQVQIGEMV